MQLRMSKVQGNPLSVRESSEKRVVECGRIPSKAFGCSGKSVKPVIERNHLCPSCSACHAGNLPTGGHLPVQHALLQQRHDQPNDLRDADWISVVWIIH